MEITLTKEEVTILLSLLGAQGGPNSEEEKRLMERLEELERRLDSAGKDQSA